MKGYVIIKTVLLFCLMSSVHIARATNGCGGIVIIGSDTNELLKTVDSLIKNKTSDREKIKAVYEWVTTNIHYDYEREKTYRTINFQERSVGTTFELKKGICSDFARLTSCMLAAAKIKCAVIYGFARGDEKDFFSPLDELRHAWNAVFVDNKWLFMDPTWASCNRGSDFGEDYFLISPEAFMFSHFPEDKNWLLLNRSLTYDEFEQLPIVSSHFYKFIKTDPPKKGVYTTDNDFIIINDLPIDSITAQQLNVTIMKTNSDDPNDAGYTMIEQNKRSFLKVKIPEKGKYYISIIGAQPEEDGLLLYVNLISFFVERK